MSRSATCPRSRRMPRTPPSWITEAGAKALPLAGRPARRGVLRRDRRADRRGVRRARHPRAERGVPADRTGIENLATAEFDRVFRTNLYAQMLHRAGGGSAPRSPARRSSSRRRSRRSDPSHSLIDYAMTKAAQVAFIKALAEELGAARHPRQRRRARPHLDAAHPRDRVGRGASSRRSGQDTPLGRAGQPAELAGAYVYLACDDGLVHVGRRAAGHRRQGAVTAAARRR